MVGSRNWFYCDLHNQNCLLHNQTTTKISYIKLNLEYEAVVSLHNNNYYPYHSVLVGIWNTNMYAWFKVQNCYHHNQTEIKSVKNKHVSLKSTEQGSRVCILLGVAILLGIWHCELLSPNTPCLFTYRLSFLSWFSIDHVIDKLQSWLYSKTAPSHCICCKHIHLFGINSLSPVNETIF